MDNTLMARALFGTSLGFHIIFATMGVGVPLMVVLAEISASLTGDPDYRLMAKRWTKGFTVLLGVSIPSGTIVAVQMQLLWPVFMKMVGQVIALPFLIEIFAFFLEALFMSIYVYAADRLSTPLRIASVFFVAVGAGLSAILITDANAFMNTPQGFTVENGRAVNIHPWQAVFNPSFPTSASHVLFSAYMTVGFVMASVAAYKLLRVRILGREAVYHQKALMLSLFVGGTMGILTAMAGHFAGQMLTIHLPEKLAAAEGLFDTTAYAPLVIGGVTDPVTGSLIGGISIPGLLSFLSTGHFSGVVHGLHDYPRNMWPPLFIHVLYDMMIGVGTLLVGVAVAAWAVKTMRRNNPYPFWKWALGIFVLTGPLSMIGIESGWTFACIGRQPWIIYHILRTVDAVTRSTNVGVLFVLFVSLYILLGVATIVVLRSYFRRYPLSDELTQDNVKVKRTVWLP